MTFSHTFDHLPRQPTELDTKPFDLFEDPEPLELLDSAIMSPNTADRRDSFATASTPFFSPQSTVGTPWEDSFPVLPGGTTTLPERHASISSHFEGQAVSNNPFHNAQANWIFDRAVDSRTPVAQATYEPFNGDLDASTPFSAASAVPAFGGFPVLSNVRPAAIMAPTAGATPLPASPGGPGNEWMGVAERDNIAHNRVPKRIRQSSPPRSLSPGIMRRDGVRKKNARFEIPPERSLLTIDTLIANSTNEEEIKELKQQKRLLRNRQAAYVLLSDLVLSIRIIIGSIGP
jgi:hypothetical protein